MPWDLVFGGLIVFVLGAVAGAWLRREIGGLSK